MTHAFASIDELGEGYGFRKVRRALGVGAFGVNAIVAPPGHVGFAHYHDEQDELYFVHSGRARFEMDGDVRELGPGGLCHVELLVVGGKGGYVERDGHLVDDADAERRAAFGKS